jgi:hypothetical protein
MLPIMLVHVLTYMWAALFLQAVTPAMTCQQSQPDRAAKKTTIQNLTVTIAPSAKPEDVEEACTADVRDRSGKVVFQSQGFNTELMDTAGRDIDNDGHPDIVVGTDTGGGNRCCWGYVVISPVPRPRVVAKLPPARFEDDNGKTVIWTTVAFYDLGPSMAESPVVEQAQQFRKGRLEEVTADYCPGMLANQARGYASMTDVFEQLTSVRKRASQQSTGAPSDEVRQTRVAATTLALQAVYCGRDDMAATVLRDVWPAGEQAEMRATIRKAAGSQWPAIAQRLTNWK